MGCVLFLCQRLVEGAGLVLAAGGRVAIVTELINLAACEGKLLSWQPSLSAALVVHERPLLVSHARSQSPLVEARRLSLVGVGRGFLLGACL